MEQLKAIYEQYELDARQAIEKASPTDGLFGMGADPKRHPCHEKFYEGVGAWVREFVSSDPTAAEAAEAAEWIVKAAAAHRNSSVYWYMYAAQGHVKPLIERMDPQQCQSLLKWYDKAYPKIERMPVQKAVYKLLWQYAKAKK